MRAGRAARKHDATPWRCPPPTCVEMGHCTRFWGRWNYPQSCCTRPADAFAKNPIGSGPYKVVRNDIGSLIQLEALERHWREGVPKFKTVTFLLVPEESTRLAQLRTGEADIIAVSREKVPEVKAAG